jgi:hypothetical protein
MAHSRFYDSVLQELAAGNMQDGINLLVGMLDTVDQQPEQFGAACDELRVHRLGSMLREDPCSRRVRPVRAAIRRCYS